jgi:hypothetical protein
MSWVDTRQSRDESSFNTISQRGALWDHLDHLFISFPSPGFSRSPV